jgi:hypothetical protein
MFRTAAFSSPASLDAPGAAVARIDGLRRRPFSASSC